MSFPSLTERPWLALGGTRGASRAQERQTPDRGASDGSQERAESQEAPKPHIGESPAPRIVSLDFAALAEIGERETPSPLGATVVEFLAAFAALLTSVSSGDVPSARDAANILQLELFGSPGDAASDEDAPLRMLEDLVALIRFARLGDLGSAEAAAALLARHMQTALFAPPNLAATAERLIKHRRGGRPSNRGEPQTLAQGATAAYELLMDPEPDANAA